MRAHTLGIHTIAAVFPCPQIRAFSKFVPKEVVRHLVVTGKVSLYAHANNACVDCVVGCWVHACARVTALHPLNGCDISLLIDARGTINPHLSSCQTVCHRVTLSVIIPSTPQDARLDVGERTMVSESEREHFPSMHTLVFTPQPSTHNPVYPGTHCCSLSREAFPSAFFTII